MPLSDDELDALLPPLPDDLFDERGYVRRDRLEQVRDAVVSGPRRVSQTAPSTTPSAALSGPSEAERAEIAVQLRVEAGEDEATARRVVMRDHPVVLAEMREAIDARHDFNQRLQAEREARAHAESPEGRAEAALQALAEKEARAANLRAARAYAEQHPDLPPDAHEALPEADLLDLAGFDPRPQRDAEADDVEANLRAGGEKGGDE